MLLGRCRGHLPEVVLLLLLLLLLLLQVQCPILLHPGVFVFKTFALGPKNSLENNKNSIGLILLLQLPVLLLEPHDFRTEGVVHLQDLLMEVLETLVGLAEVLVGLII